MNFKSAQVWETRLGTDWQPVPPESCPNLSEWPSLLEEDRPGKLGRRSGIRVFIQYWNNTTDEGRQAMLHGDFPAEQLSHSDAAIVAAVVHGLCDDRNIEPPQWVYGFKAAEPTVLFGIPAESTLGRKAISEAMSICEQHNVFFGRDTLHKV